MQHDNTETRGAINSMSNNELESKVGVGWRSPTGCLVLEQKSGVFEAQMWAQRVNATVGSGAVGAERALSCVAVEVVPAVGHFLAARLAAPQSGALGRRHEHAVIRVLRRPRASHSQAAPALCNTTRRHATSAT